MVFPKNNLPTDSQPWTRDVEKRVENLESSFRSAEVNNVTRDSQTLSQIRRLDAAVTDVTLAAQQSQEAIDAVLSLGTDGSTYNINAGNISGGTISGVNFETTGGTESLNLSAGKINFFEGGSPVGSMTADTDGSNNYIQITSNSSEGQLTVGTDYSVLGGSGAGVQVAVVDPGRIDFTATYVYCNAELDVNGSLSSNAFNSTSISTGPIDASSVSSTGNISTSSGNITTGSGNIYSNGSLGSNGALYTNSTLQRTALSGGTLTGASVTADGFFVRTSSSERYKQDISELEIPYESILQLKPKKFRRKDEVESRGDEARYYAGFIAEDLAGTDLDIFAFYERDEDGGRPDGVHYPELTAALISAIKHQDTIIKSLEARISALEA